MDIAFFRMEETSLPIFRGEITDLSLFYTPGFLCAANAASAAEISWQLTQPYPGYFLALQLVQAARQAKERWERQHDPISWQPVCLTIYSSLRCNLACGYCFSAPHEQVPETSTEFILDSARSLLPDCRRSGKPLSVVFHGGGEPSLDPRLPELFTQLKAIAKEAGIMLSSYLATNGVMSNERARWIARNFEAVGLSVDGAPDLQNRQRPLAGGGDSSESIESSAAIFREGSARFSVRLTVTPESLPFIDEAVHYLCEQIRPQEIHLEAAFAGSDHKPVFVPEDADAFCTAFSSARNIARAAGIPLNTSGSRIREIHGRYCQVFRQVRQLVPGEAVSACFKCGSRAQAAESGLLLPQNERDFATLCARLAADDPRCAECFNQFHCARGCPDSCPLQNAYDSKSFRCRVNRRLAAEELLQLAEENLFSPARAYGFAGVQIS